jgi:hypothetical protein
VAATFMRASRGVEQTVRGGLTALGRRTLIGVWAVATVAIFLTVLVLSLAKATDVGGVVSGVFGAFFVALLFAGGFAWLLMWWMSSAAAPAHNPGEAAALETLLAPTLRELDAVRADVAAQVKRRSIMRVPLGAAAALLFWVLTQFSDDPFGAFELVMFMVVGAAAGEVWAIGHLDRDYRRRYKDQVLPHLAAQFGNLTYRHASTPNIQKLHQSRILRDFDNAVADDEITGTHRGLPISIVEIRSTQRSGDDERVVFDGLLIELTLPRALTGTTVIVSDEGLIGNFKTRWRADALEHVRLEDPTFEKHYEVYSNNQIESRALLTPAFMQRFTTMAERTGFSLPGARAEGNQLVIALPKRMPVDLFEPPVYWKHTGGKVLLDLSRDIEAVLAMADTVIDLDFWASGSRDHGREGSGPPSIA